MVATSSPFLAAALICSRAAADTGRQERRRRPQKRPLLLPLLDCQFHLARTSPFTFAATAGSGQVPQRVPMGIRLPAITAYSPCPGVDKPLMEVGAGIDVSGGRVDALRCASLPPMLTPVSPPHCHLLPAPLPPPLALPFLLAIHPTSSLLPYPPPWPPHHSHSLPLP